MIYGLFVLMVRTGYEKNETVIVLENWSMDCFGGNAITSLLFSPIENLLDKFVKWNLVGDKNNGCHMGTLINTASSTQASPMKHTFGPFLLYN